MKNAIREISFNMRRGNEDIEGGSENFYTPEKGALKKKIGLGGGAPKIFIFQNQQEGEG